LENVIKNNQLVEPVVGEVCMTLGLVTDKLQVCDHEQSLSRYHAFLQHGENMCD